MDHTINIGLNGSIQYVTQSSEVVIKMEDMKQPLNNVLHGH